MLSNSASILPSVVLLHVIQFSVSVDLICTGSSYHAIQNEGQLNTLRSNITIHSYVSQQVCGNSISYAATQDLWKASRQPLHSVSHLRVSQCHPFPHIIWRFHKFLWIGNRTRSPGAVIPVNPRANDSAEAMVPVGTARIVASQSVKVTIFWVPFLSSPLRPNPSSNSPGANPVYSRGISQNLLKMEVCEADSRTAGHRFVTSCVIHRFIAGFTTFR